MPNPIILKVSPESIASFQELTNAVQTSSVNVSKLGETVHMTASEFNAFATEQMKINRAHSENISMARSLTSSEQELADIVKEGNAELAERRRLAVALGATIPQVNSALSQMAAREREAAEAMGESNSWMAKNHLVAGHYAAMLDRMMGLHTGLATVLRSAFNPAMIGIGIALAAVALAVKQWNKEEQELETQLKKSESNIEKRAQAIRDMGVEYKNLSPEMQHILELDQSIQKMKLDEEAKKHAEAIAHLHTKFLLVTPAIDGMRQSFMMLVGPVVLAWKAFKDFEDTAFKWVDKDSKETIAAMEKLEKQLGPLSFLIHGQTEAYRKLITQTDILTTGTSDLNEKKAKSKDIQEQLAALHEKAIGTNPALISATNDYVKTMDDLNKKLLANLITQAQFNQATADAAAIYLKIQEEVGKKDASHFNHILDEKKRAQERHEELMLRLMQDGASKQVLIAQMAAKKEEFATDELFRHHIISKKQHDQEIAASEKILADRLLAIKGEEAKKYADIQLGLDNEIMKMNNELMKNSEKDLAKYTKTEADAIKRRTKNWQAYYKERERLERHVAHEAVSLLNSTGNKQMQMVGKVVGYVQQAYQLWKEAELVLALFRKATAAEAHNDETQKSISQAEMSGQKTAINAASAVAGTPYVGPILAAIQMALWEATTQSVVAGITASSSIGQRHAGGAVERTGSYDLVGGETVAPKTFDFAAIEAAILGNQSSLAAGRGSGSTHYHYHGTVIQEAQAKRDIRKYAKQGARYGG